MAAPRLCTAHVVLLIASLCCISLSHGRIPREVRALKSSFSGVTVSDCSPPPISEPQNSSPGRGKIVSSIGDADSGWQAEGHSISVVPGKKWKRTLGKVAEWVLHACAVLLAVFVAFYTLSCICACCIGLDLLAAIWRTLGGCRALRALLSYFVSAEQALVEGDARSVPLVAGSAQ